MARNWEEKCRAWSKPSSDTEELKCANAERMIKEAVRQSDRFNLRRIEVFAQGSYRNNTNVRIESDVDVCVRCMDTFTYDFSQAQGIEPHDAGIEPAVYKYSEFKDDLELALVSKFGQRGVSRGNKAFDIHENTYRVAADVVPAFEYRMYTHRDIFGKPCYLSGVVIYPDDGGKIVNWPEQHHRNGVDKNNLTNNRFKYLTRILKRLRYEMEENNIQSSLPMASFLIECLVWNVPNSHFCHLKYVDDLRSVLAYIYNETLSSSNCQEWAEVNGIKYLFHHSQPWSRQQAHRFIGDAWDYLGFE